MQRPIAVIVVSQLCGTSLWFSANSAVDDLRLAWRLTPGDLGWLTNAVQAGFIVGTLLFALTGLADRFAASRIFVVASVAGAAFNAAFALGATSLASALPLRFVVGLCLAGIYPLGMKLVVRWAPDRAARSLGWLVAMLTLGTALPHGIRAAGGTLPWQAVMAVSSGLAVAGALLVGLLGDGPARRGALRPPSAAAVLQAFRIPAFRASAFGYFGHMWELYAFWTIVPLLLVPVLADAGAASSRSIASWSFVVIAGGSIGCIVGGSIGFRVGSARVAFAALAASGIACLIYPLADAWPATLRVALLVAWGIAVISDSPQFSALSAKACPPEWIGSALAIQNSLGFLVSTVSIALATTLGSTLGSRVAWLLLPGPVLGLLGLSSWRRRAPLQSSS